MASAIALAGLLALAALLLVVRRIFGALSGSLSPAEVTLAALAVSIVAMGIRLLGRNAAAGRELVRLIIWVPLVCVLFILVSLLPSTSMLGAVLLTGVLLAEEALALSGGRWKSYLRRAVKDQAVRVGSREAEISDGGSPEKVLQQIAYSVGPAGEAIVRGVLRTPFEPGQRTAAAHVAFCPPLPKAPTVTVSQTAGPGCRIKVAQTLPYGMRLELRLMAPADALSSVECRFMATAAGGPADR